MKHGPYSAKEAVDPAKVRPSKSPTAIKPHVDASAHEVHIAAGGDVRKAPGFDIGGVSGFEVGGVNTSQLDPGEARELYCRTAASPRKAEDAALHMSVNYWANAWAYLPRHMFWKRWWAWRATSRIVREIKRRRKQ